MADPEQSGGVAVDLLVHDFDQMNWLLGEPRRVFAHSPRVGHVTAVVEYDGASGFAEGSVSMPRSYPFSSDIRVLCEGGGAEYAFSAAPVEGEGNIGASDSARGLNLFPNEGEATTVAVESADPWGPEIEYFVDCVENGRQPTQGTGAQARDALLVSLAANRSLASGEPENL
jgi:UDP-N-acetylglucosamine 3-dehydrogenase